MRSSARDQSTHFAALEQHSPSSCRTKPPLVRFGIDQTAMAATQRHLTKFVAVFNSTKNAASGFATGPNVSFA